MDKELTEALVKLSATATQFIELGIHKIKSADAEEQKARDEFRAEIAKVMQEMRLAAAVVMKDKERVH